MRVSKALFYFAAERKTGIAPTRIIVGRREAGVGFAVKSSLVGKLVGPPKGVNDRLMIMRLPLSNGKKFATIVSAYAPTMTNPDEVKDKFYQDLNAVITTLPNADKLQTSVWRTTGRETLSRWPEEAIQRHSQGFSEGLQHKPHHMGADSPGQRRMASGCPQRS